MRTFAYKPGYLEGGNDICSAPMTLDQAMHACIEAGTSIGITWNGDREPRGAVTVYVKSAQCSQDVGEGAGWHTLLLLPPTVFEYAEGYLASGNDLVVQEMTLDEAREAASAADSIGFCWSGDRELQGKIGANVKNLECSTEVWPSAGWHTMLKMKQEHEGCELVYSKATQPPKSHDVEEDFGTWPAAALAGLERGGVGNVGFREDPLPAVLRALGGAKFVDAEFPPLPVSIGQGVCGSAIAGNAGSEFPPLSWRRTSELFDGMQKKRSKTSKKSVRVSFVNRTRYFLEMFWVGFDGSEQRFGELAPGGTIGPQSTYGTHVWRFRSRGTGGDLLTYTCTDEAVQTVEVTSSESAGEQECELCPAHLFRDGSCVAHDVVQGQVGDCWLMQSLASAANRFPDQVVESINPKTISEQGVYSIKFWSPQYNCFFYVLVDDYLPTANGTDPYFAQLNPRGDGVICWLALYEKAFAKLQGSFAQLDAHSCSDSPSTALCRMLGGEPGARAWGESDWAELTDTGVLWTEMLERAAAGRCSTLSSAKGDCDTELVGQHGLVTYHGYTLMDLVEINGHRLLKIRNVWGQQEWNGDWSDESPKWKEHPDIAEALCNKTADDGIFWMAYPDFVRRFCIIWHN